MSLFNVIAERHLRCSFFVDHLKFPCRASRPANLPTWQVHVCHHAARAATADTFKDRQRRLHDFRELLDAIALFWTKRQSR
jgi:hypothetical protein